jgi:hypothetical protein
MALRLFGTKVIQEVFESEVVSAFKQVTDAEGESDNADVSVCRMKLERPE